MADIDEKFGDKYFKEEIVYQSKDLPNKIKKSIEKGKLIEKEWNNNKLNILINDCINIENNINNIKDMEENIKKSNLNKNKIFLQKNENEINEIKEKIKKFGNIEVVQEGETFDFQFKPGKNYVLDNNCLIATKNNGGDEWNCTILGNKEIPKNKKTHWKIKINNFELKPSISWNILIGVGPDNPNNKTYFFNKCWTFIC